MGQSFNGAATFSLRKAILDLTDKVCGVTFNGAATFSLRKAAFFASASAASTAFNGAATFSLRKVVVPHIIDLGVKPPSMGPQLFRCGKVMTLVSTHSKRAALQWGRNFFVAERRSNPPLFSLFSYPSMGPQLFRCGKDG